MKRFLALIIAIVTLLSIIPMSISAEGEAAQAEKQTVVFLKYSKDGDSNDGRSADKAVSTFAKAYSLLDLSQDCTVVVCGAVGIADVFSYGESYTGSVTFTSVYGGVDYLTTGSAVINTNANGRFVCWGDTAFDNVKINHKEKNFIIFVQGHDLTIKENVTVTTATTMTGQSVSTAFSVICGFQNNYPTEDTVHNLDDHKRESHVTVLSGEKLLVCAFNRLVPNGGYNDHYTGSNAFTHTGDTYITVGGNANVSSVYYTSIGDSNTDDGNVVVTVKDSATIENIQGVAGNVTNINVKSLTVNWLGGTIKNVNKNNGNVTGISVLKYVEDKSTEAAALMDSDTTPFKECKSLGKIEFYGHQTKVLDADNNFDLRLLAVITEKDISQYNYVGFKVILQIGKLTFPEYRQDINTVYGEITAGSGTEYEDFTAANLGGEYIFALNCNGIPVESETTTVTLTVTPYYKINGQDEQDGTQKTFEAVIRTE